MPIYEYKCKQCEDIFEYFHVSKEDNNVACPKCNSKEVTKVMSFSQPKPGGFPPSPKYSFPPTKYQ